MTNDIHAHAISLKLHLKLSQHPLLHFSASSLLSRIFFIFPKCVLDMMPRGSVSWSLCCVLAFLSVKLLMVLGLSERDTFLFLLGILLIKELALKGQEVFAMLAAARVVFNWA